MKKARVVWLLPAGALIGLLMVLSIAGQDRTATIDLKPVNPTTKESIAFTISGVWSNGCVPSMPKVSIASGTIRIDTSYPGEVCTAALTPWSLTGSLGVLAAGDYLISVTYFSPGLSAPLEIGRKAFTVTSSSITNEAILPIVVNGAVGENSHYQTIFTVLNASSQDVHVTLEVFNGEGKAAGVFCSPLEPPPSSVTTTLTPGAELFRFTSADLPFLNGWARLRWDGSSSVLAGAELTLVAAPPDRCLLVCNRPSNEKLSSAQIPAVRPAREFRFPLTLNRNRQTAMAIVNPSSVDTLIASITVLDGSGSNAELGIPNHFEVKIGPQQRVSKFVWEMVIEATPTFAPVPFPEGFQGSVIVSSTSDFALGALNIMFPEGKFVSVPAVSP
jgi:hypothetical protein